MKTVLLFTLLASTLLTVSQGAAEVWYVDADGTPGVDCDCVTIAACVDSASVGDTVLVACGVYKEHDIIMKSGICLRSETGEASCVTIDAEQQGRVINCEDVDATSVIEGLTAINGLPGGPWSETRGGGLSCFNSSPTIVSCAFSGNCAYDGGGVFCEDSSPVLEQCKFCENSATVGGGMGCGYSSPVVYRCEFSRNWAQWGGAVVLYNSTITLTSVDFSENAADHGSGIHSDSSPATLTDCTFSGNSASERGGAMSLTWGASTELDDCVLTANSAGSAGGAVYCYYYSHPSLSNCTLSDNAAPHGCGVYCRDSSPALTNTIVAFGKGGEPVCCYGYSEPSLACCDVYGNLGGDWVDCIADQYGINGNISECPLFCDPENGDFRLQECSPCAPGNHPDGSDCGLIGALDVGCECGEPSAVERSTWGAVKSLYR